MQPPARAEIDRNKHACVYTHAIKQRHFGGMSGNQNAILSQRDQREKIVARKSGVRREMLHKTSEILALDIIFLYLFSFLPFCGDLSG